MSTEALAQAALALLEEFERAIENHENPRPGGQHVTPSLAGFGPDRLPYNCRRNMEWWVKAIREAEKKGSKKS